MVASPEEGITYSTTYIHASTRCFSSTSGFDNDSYLFFEINGLDFWG
jgi:hypothetical protein